MKFIGIFHGCAVFYDYCDPGILHIMTEIDGDGDLYMIASTPETWFNPLDLEC